MDLEATCLKDAGRPRISELSLVAVRTEDFLQWQDRIDRKAIPRILNKLTICVNPMSLILPEVSSITGLDNYNLFEQTKFDASLVRMINDFVKRLPAAVCLVAHNGDKYDFPLLKAEIHKCGEKIDHSLLCADSYKALKSIIESKQNIKQNISFSLGNLYNKFFGSFPEFSHGAEEDCYTLMKVSSVFNADFIDWIEDNNYKFRHCFPMWYMADNTK